MAFCPGYAIGRACSIHGNCGCHVSTSADDSDRHAITSVLVINKAGAVYRYDFALGDFRQAHGSLLKNAGPVCAAFGKFGIHAAGWDTTSEMTASIERRTASLGGNNGKRGGPP